MSLLDDKHHVTCTPILRDLGMYSVTDPDGRVVATVPCILDAKELAAKLDARVRVGDSIDLANHALTRCFNLCGVGTVTTVKPLDPVNRISMVIIRTPGGSFLHVREGGER